MRKILFFTQSDENCAASRVRVFQYLPYLRENNFQCRVIPVMTGFLSKGAYLNSKHPLKLVYLAVSLILLIVKSLQVIMLARQYDIIFIQRVVMFGFLVDLLRWRNDNIIFDFDDAVYAGTGSGIYRYYYRKKRECLNYILKVSKAVIVTNSVLAEYVKKQRSNK